MPKINIPIGLPDSVLLHELAKKTASLRTAPARTPVRAKELKIKR
jgi:hypothetical protein